MMTRLFTLLLFISLSSCFQYETQFEGPYTEEEEDTTVETVLPLEIVYVAGGQVYLANKFVKDSVLILGTEDVDIASINNEHTKVAFKSGNDDIEIYDIELKRIVDKIPGSSTAIWFDFHANNNTLYYLANNLLYTHGPEIFTDMPINLRSLSGIPGDVRGVAVLADGTFFYSMSSFGTFNRRYLLFANENEVTDISEINAYELRMRINQEENTLWSEDEFDNFLNIWGIPDLRYIDSESAFSFGAPISETRGYKITSDNEIYTPEFQYIQSPNGKITSIDY